MSEAKRVSKTMRKNWTRDSGTIALTEHDITELIKPLNPASVLASFTYAEGGLANTNIRVDIAGAAKPLMLRILTRDPKQGAKEYNLHKLIAGKVPCAHILHYQDTNSITGHPYLIMEWVEGSRVDDLFGKISTEEVSELGYSIGAALANMHSFQFTKAGFFNAELEVVTPIENGSEGVLQFAQQCLCNPIASERLGNGLRDEVLGFITAQTQLLDAAIMRPSLTHCDFGGSNILASKSDKGWTVAGILDWEFAISANPLIDLGNLLRDPIGSAPGFSTAIEIGYQQAGGVLPGAWRRLSRLYDLLAWFEFLTRPQAGEQLVSDCKNIILDTMVCTED